MFSYAENANNLLIDGFLDDAMAMQHHAKLTGTQPRRYHTSAVHFMEEKVAS